MVYFGKKQGGGSIPANAATKDGNNVFTGTNTFNNGIVSNTITSSTNQNINLNPNGTGRINASADIQMNNHYIGDLHEPNSAQDAATKNYVDNGDIPNIVAANTQYSYGRQTFLGSQVYCKYIDKTVSIPAGDAEQTIEIANGITGNIVGINLFADGQYLIPGLSGTVYLTTLFENQTVKLKAKNGSWVHSIKGMIFYTL